MKFAYNTNGWRFQPIDDTLRTLAEIGYSGIEFGVQPNHLPPSSWSASEAARLRRLAKDLGLAVTNLHLGAADLLSSTPYEPSFLALYPSQRDERIDLVRRGIDFAAELGAPLVCFESGPLPPDMPREAAMCHLIDGVEACVKHAEMVGIRLAIEPSPQQLVNSYPAYLEVWRAFDLSAFGLCYDIGHAYCAYEDIGAVIADAPEILHVHIEDMADRTHRHLLPGEGEIDLGAALAALTANAYDGYVSVELMDHHRDPAFAARHSLEVLTSLVDAAGPRPDRPGPTGDGGLAVGSKTPQPSRQGNGHA